MRQNCTFLVFLEATTAQKLVKKLFYSKQDNILTLKNIMNITYLRLCDLFQPLLHTPALLWPDQYKHTAIAGNTVQYLLHKTLPHKPCGSRYQDVGVSVEALHAGLLTA